MDLIVARDEDRLSVKSFLVRRFPGLSQMYLRSRVYQQHCHLDGELVENWGRKLRPGQIIAIDVDLDAATARRPEPIPLHIVEESDDWVVVNKPAGMLVHPTMKVKSGTLANALAAHLNGARFWFPHRLDQETSGLVIVAKTAEALRKLTKAWTSGNVHKQYIALVEGQPTSCEIDAPIDRIADRTPPWGVTEGGKPSLSRLTVIEASRVALEPVTGRTNQLRIHCAHIGHPIVGDKLYGTAGPRMYLHARSLSLLGHEFIAEPDF